MAAPSGTDESTGGGIALALRRVVVGYRVVSVAWLWLLAAVVLVTEPQARVAIVLGAALLATLWSVATVALAERASVLLRSALWLGADVAVSGAVIILSTAAGSERGFSGGYPFSTVALAAYGGGYPGAIGAAVVLSVVSFVELGADAISSSLVYLAGAGVLVWAIGVIRRNEAERQALEQRLATEQAERARSQERADTGAALHDSVLQTLALIQRRSDDPAAVSTLARRQERDLRDWLGGRGRLGGGDQAMFAAALADAAADVEADYPITVEVVAVGDAAIDDRLAQVVAAAREAMLNAAKHAGVATASVYAEIGDDTISVFVRDRGAGFDPRAVPADRRGVSSSIVDRVERSGGSAVIRSAPGAGTEVELSLPR